MLSAWRLDRPVQEAVPAGLDKSFDSSDGRRQPLRSGGTPVAGRPMFPITRATTVTR